MKTLFKILLFVILVSLPLWFTSCAGPGHVTVGVGVGVMGPWGGPYPGGGVWVGRPYPGPYYPYQQDKNTDFGSMVDQFEPKPSYSDSLFTESNDPLVLSPIGDKTIQ